MSKSLEKFENSEIQPEDRILIIDERSENSHLSDPNVWTDPSFTR